jgi:hypothetical protein
MKWLLRRITRDQVKLSPAQLRDVADRVNQYASAAPFATLLNFIPGALPLLATPFWKHLQRIWSLPVYILFEVAFVFVVCALMYWIFQRRYRRFAWRAVRELGFADVCARCGYRLAGLPPDRTACPECGKYRGLFVPADWKPDEHQP